MQRLLISRSNVTLALGTDTYVTMVVFRLGFGDWKRAVK